MQVMFPKFGTGVVVGDGVRNYFNIDGREIVQPGHLNQMVISRDHLRRIPLGIGVANGASKAQAIIGAARSGMVTALVTNHITARTVLDVLRDAD